MSLKNKLVRKVIKHYVLSKFKRSNNWLTFTAMGTAVGVGATLLARSAIRYSREHDRTANPRRARFTVADSVERAAWASE